MRLPQLDARLQAAIELGGDMDTFADIGADHGHLSAALLAQSPTRRALVADVSAPALKKAQLLLGRLGLDRRAVFAVADGLDALAALPKGEDGFRRVEVIFLLGMGGHTLSGILKRGQNALDGARLVLCAQTEQPELRQALCDIGYRLRSERLAKTDERRYVLMLATPAASDEPTYTERERWLGPCLLRDHPPLFTEWLLWRQRLLSQNIAAMESAGLAKDRERLNAFCRERDYVQAALAQKEDAACRP